MRINLGLQKQKLCFTFIQLYSHQMLGKLQIRINHFLKLLTNTANLTVIEFFCNMTFTLANLCNSILQLFQRLTDSSGNDSRHNEAYNQNTACYPK